jgi:hypothetical protein
MIKLSSLISEKFEIPPALEKQLENTAYSAMGYILAPNVEKFKKKIFSNKELNEKSYQGLKNVFDAIRKMTHGSGGNTKLTYTDVLVPEYYSVTIAKKMMRKVNVTIEKTEDSIYAQSDEKKDRLFPNLVINKDYAGWDLKRLNDAWNQFDISYKDFQKEFDNAITTDEQIINTLKSWQSLDKARKPKIHPDGQKMALVYENKEMPDNPSQKYDHYFRVLPSQKAETYHSPDHFSGASRPYIVQTVYLDQFSPDTHAAHFFFTDTKRILAIARHEGRHLIQHYGQIDKKLKGDFYGLSKKRLTHQYNTDVRGTDTGGAAIPNSRNREPNDKWNRVLHPHRDVEFKTNLYDYKENFEEFLRLDI